MRKLLLSSIVALACTAANAQSSNDFEAVARLDHTYNPRIIPSSLTSDKKALLSYCENDAQPATTKRILVLDDNFNNLRTIAAEPISIELKTYVKQKVETVEFTTYTYPCTTEGVESEEAAIKAIAKYSWLDVNDIKLFKEEDGVKYYILSNEYFYMQGIFGEKYPHNLYSYSKGQPVKRISYQYNGFSFNGEWGEKEEYHEPETKYFQPFMFIRYQDFDSNMNNSDFYASQTLFNSDDKYEYLSPIIEITERVNGNDLDMDGEPDVYYYNEDFAYTGFRVMSEDGEELASIRYEDGTNYYNDAMIFKLNGKTFLSFYLQGNGKFLNKIYEMVQGSSGVNTLRAAASMNVSPRVAERNEDITVEAEGTGIREVVVTDAAGRMVYSTKVAAGQQTVKINSGILSSGLNIVSVKANDGKSENCKVIVKK